MRLVTTPPPMVSFSFLFAVTIYRGHGADNCLFIFQDGPPLTIAWKPQLSTTYDIDFFEKFERKTSRPMEGLSIPGVERIRLLNMSGFSNHEISKVMKECKKIQRFRENSINGMHWDFFAAASESSREFLSSSLGRFKTAVQQKNGA
jgi:hypothetical protein